MKTLKLPTIVFMPSIVTGLLLAATPVTQAAATIWNGPTISFTHSTATGNLSDQLTSGVVLTRSTSGGGLYNSASEGGATGGISPADTKWAIGSLANYNTLTYGACPLEAGNHPPGYVNTTFVVHLVSEDIYFSLTLTGWGGQGGVGDKSFSYTRSTAAPPTPTVAITNPPSGAVFAAPANINIGASATVSSGTVTNVQFFTNGVLLKSVQSSPFTFTASNLAAGVYALTAAATAAGISATSAVVNITVDVPPTVSIIAPGNNATLSAPANVTIQASASDSDGSVTNVQFLVGPDVLTNASTAPFSGTTNNLGAGSYTLSAIASDNNGLKNTNVISITVVTPVAVSLGRPVTSSATNFQFSYSANVGLSYVIQRSTNLASANWISLVTNTAASNPVVFEDIYATNSSVFYRVGRLPNP